MKTTLSYTIFLFCFLMISSSCESEVERKQREARKERQRIELEAQKRQEAKEIAFQKEQEKIQLEARLERERKEKAIYDKYINNSLRTGATPYSYCFGRNRSCSDSGCSQIKVRTPSNSDVVVTIKKNGKVYRHAYIDAGSRYEFEFPNGTYQTFFYYGKGWNPDKVMKETDCGTLKGGFITDEHFGKDNPQSLRNNILEYELILQQNGNFSTRPSNSDEAF
ncbi:MAG: hypothetical protein P1U70_18745 [Saprospiraceae bacterium]|nr:hypothetical protein [Saprospiraceae bacterium]